MRVCRRRDILQIDGDALKNYSDVASYHVALEASEIYDVGFAKYNETTKVRECVTLKSPGKIVMGKKERVGGHLTLCSMHELE